jgi:hypothetical protein
VTGGRPGYLPVSEHGLIGELHRAKAGPSDLKVS